MGACPLRKFLEFKGYEVASETIFGPKRCFSEARRQSFTCMNIYPFCPLRHIALHGFDFPIVRQSHKPHPSQIVRLEEQKIVGRLGLSHCSQPSRIMLQHVTTLCACHGMGVCRALAYLATPSKQWVRERDRLSSHSSMRLRHKTSHGSSPCPPHNRDNPLST